MIAQYSSDIVVTYLREKKVTQKTEVDIKQNENSRHVNNDIKETWLHCIFYMCMKWWMSAQYRQLYTWTQWYSYAKSIG